MYAREGTYASLSIHLSIMSQYDHIDVILHVGFDVDDMDVNTSTDSSDDGSIDPFDFVYSNYPDSMTS